MNNSRAFSSNDDNTVPWYSYVLGAFLSFVILVTIAGNVMVIIAVIKERRLKTSFNYYIVNLTVTDISVGLIAMTFYTIDNVSGYWPLGSFLCGVWICCDYAMTFESIFTLVLISMDRFWAVTWSLHYRRNNTRRKSIIIIVCSWIYMFTLWLPAFIVDRITNEHDETCIWEPSSNKAFAVALSVIGYHGPCILLLFCYVKVFIFMRKRMKSKTLKSIIAPIRTVSTADILDRSEYTDQQHKNRSEAGSTVHISEESPTTNDTQSGDRIGFRLEILHPPGQYLNVLTPTKVSSSNNLNSCTSDTEHSSNTDSHSTNPSKNPEENAPRKSKKEKEKRVFITLSYVVVGYLICWLPFHIVFDIRTANPNLVPATVYSIAIWMAYINSTLNPFLYNLSNADFRKAFSKLFCICR